MSQRCVNSCVHEHEVLSRLVLVSGFAARLLSASATRESSSASETNPRRRSWELDLPHLSLDVLINPRDEK
jgi:hypothetical protein